MAQHEQPQRMVRLTIDLPAKQHAILKIAAARRGITMRQFVIEHLAGVPEEIEQIDDATFKKELKKLLRTHKDTLKELSDR